MVEEAVKFVKPSVSIRRLLFSGGDEFSFLPNQKVLIVGANNSGKSKTLREIDEACSAGHTAPGRVVLKEVDLEKTGDLSDLQHYFSENALEIEGTYRIRDWSIQKTHLQFWGNDYLVNGLAAGFVRNVTAKDRLLVCEQQLSIGPNDPMSKPQHVLYQDDSLMLRISKLFRRSFGSDLMFDFKGGSKLPIHVGDVPAGPACIDRTSDVRNKGARGNIRLNLYPVSGRHVPAKTLRATKGPRNKGARGNIRLNLYPVSGRHVPAKTLRGRPRGRTATGRFSVFSTMAWNRG